MAASRSAFLLRHTRQVLATSLPVDVLGRLAGESVVWLTTLRSDGSPHVTPVWFCFAGHAWWVATGVNNVKVRNLRGDSRVALALPDGQRPVVAEGVAQLHSSAFPPDIVSALKEKYDWDIETPDTGRGGGHILVEIAVTSWLMLGVSQ